MLDIRCECGKIVCQSDHEFVVIKCRHCKRFMFIKNEDDNLKLMINPHYIDRSHSHFYEYSKHV